MPSRSISISGDVKIDPHIRGKLDLIRSDEDVLLLGRCRRDRCVCAARCLSEFIVEKEMNLDLRLRVGGLDAQLQHSAEQQDADVVFVESSELDPAEIILQELLLEIPMKPLVPRRMPRSLSEMRGLERLA